MDDIRLSSREKMRVIELTRVDVWFLQKVLTILFEAADISDYPQSKKFYLLLQEAFFEGLVEDGDCVQFINVSEKSG